MSRSPAQTRTRLLAAAARLIGEQGGARLTLDLVAHNAGISKGGLLHHYPTKDALVRGLTNELAAVLRSRLNREMTAYPELLPEVRAAFAFLDEDARRDGLPPARATTIRLACDGLWLGECAGLPLVPADLLPALHDDLVALSRP
jgi:AcrR family transcriptional regulator